MDDLACELIAAVGWYRLYGCIQWEEFSSECEILDKVCEAALRDQTIEKGAVYTAIDHEQGPIARSGVLLERNRSGAGMISPSFSRPLAT